MKYNVYFGLAMRIILLFTVGAFMTFLPEVLRDFFGDTKFEPYYEDWLGEKRLISRNYGSMIDDEWHWGARHYWYFWMMVCLFILSLLNVIIGGYNLVVKHYPSLKS